ncbi:MAG: hypothetical protein ISR65_11070 [Bacteriovoracaceae bacterium]|nr:hypothetical protein [Bacteriovoracaceae bacterium]
MKLSKIYLLIALTISIICSGYAFEEQRPVYCTDEMAIECTNAPKILPLENYSLSQIIRIDQSIDQQMFKEQLFAFSLSRLFRQRAELLNNFENFNPFLAQVNYFNACAAQAGIAPYKNDLDEQIQKNKSREQEKKIAFLAGHLLHAIDADKNWDKQIPKIKKMEKQVEQLKQKVDDIDDKIAKHRQQIIKRDRANCKGYARSRMHAHIQAFRVAHCGIDLEGKIASKLKDKKEHLAKINSLQTELGQQSGVLKNPYLWQFEKNKWLKAIDIDFEMSDYQKTPFFEQSMGMLKDRGKNLIKNIERVRASNPALAQALLEEFLKEDANKQIKDKMLQLIENQTAKKLKNLNSGISELCTKSNKGKDLFKYKPLVLEFLKSQAQAAREMGEEQALKLNPNFKKYQAVHCSMLDNAPSDGGNMAVTFGAMGAVLLGAALAPVTLGGSLVIAGAGGAILTGMGIKETNALWRSKNELAGLAQVDLVTRQRVHTAVKDYQYGMGMTATDILLGVSGTGSFIKSAKKLLKGGAKGGKQAVTAGSKVTNVADAASSSKKTIKISDELRNNEAAMKQTNAFIDEYKMRFEPTSVASDASADRYIARVRDGYKTESPQTMWRLENQFQKMLNDSILDKELVDALNNRYHKMFNDELIQALQKRGVKIEGVDFRDFKSIEGLLPDGDVAGLLEDVSNITGAKFERVLQQEIPVVYNRLKEVWKGNPVATPSDWFIVESITTSEVDSFNRQLLTRIAKKRRGGNRRIAPKRREPRDGVPERRTTGERRQNDPDSARKVTEAIAQWGDDFDEAESIRKSIVGGLKRKQKSKGVFEVVKGTGEWTISEGAAHVIRKVTDFTSKQERIAKVAKEMNASFQLTGRNKLSHEQIEQMILLFDKLDALTLGLLKKGGMPIGPSGEFIQMAADVKMAGALNARIVGEELIRDAQKIANATDPTQKAKAIHEASKRAEALATKEMNRASDGVEDALVETFGAQTGKHVKSVSESSEQFALRSGDDSVIYFDKNTKLETIQTYVETVGNKKLGYRARLASGTTKDLAEKGENVSKEIEKLAMKKWGPSWQQDKRIAFALHLSRRADGSEHASLILGGRDVTPRLQRELEQMFRGVSRNNNIQAGRVLP